MDDHLEVTPEDRRDDTSPPPPADAEDLLAQIDALRDEVAGGNTEARRNARRVFEALKQFGTVLDALSAAVGDLHALARATPKAPPPQEGTGSALPLIGLADRIGRVAAALEREPALPRAWLLSPARAAAPWREDRARMAESLQIITSHAAGLLQNAGLERIPAVGLQFDPACMEAAEIDPDPAAPDHAVLAEILPGWREAATGRVVRPAQVRVARNRTATPAP